LCTCPNLKHYRSNTARRKPRNRHPLLTQLHDVPITQKNLTATDLLRLREGLCLQIRQEGDDFHDALCKGKIRLGSFLFLLKRKQADSKLIQRIFLQYSSWSGILRLLQLYQSRQKHNEKEGCGSKKKNDKVCWSRIRTHVGLSVFCCSIYKGSCKVTPQSLVSMSFKCFSSSHKSDKSSKTWFRSMVFSRSV